MELKTNILLILLLFVVYLITFFCIHKSKKMAHIKFENFPKLTIKKSGIVFKSFGTHRIKINNSKIMQVGKIVYLKTKSGLVLISNVDDVKIFENYLFFTGLGQVRILFDCSGLYKFFALQIQSKQFDLSVLKQQALVDILNNDFDANFSQIAKKYIKIIEKVLNIGVFQEKIVVRQNRYHLSFVLTYKSNNRIKRINVRQTL